MECSTPDRTITVGKGSAVFINSGVLHSYHTVGSENCRIYAHLFSPQFLSGMHQNTIDEKYILPVMNNQALSMYLINPDDRAGLDMMDKILNMIALSEEELFGYELEIRAQMGRFWCRFMEDTEELRAASMDVNMQDIERLKIMIRYVHENYREKLTLDDIARAAGISDRECTRCFRKGVGNTPVNYLNLYRVNAAAQLLVQTGKSVIEISEECGFSSNSYFGKVFRESMGCTPTEYRKGKKKA